MDPLGGKFPPKPPFRGEVSPHTPSKNKVKGKGREVTKRERALSHGTARALSPPPHSANRPVRPRGLRPGHDAPSLACAPLACVIGQLCGAVVAFLQNGSCLPSANARVLLAQARR